MLHFSLIRFCVHINFGTKVVGWVIASLSNFGSQRNRRRHFIHGECASMIVMPSTIVSIIVVFALRQPKILEHIGLNYVHQNEIHWSIAPQKFSTLAKRNYVCRCRIAIKHVSKFHADRMKKIRQEPWPNKRLITFDSGAVVRWCIEGFWRNNDNAQPVKSVKVEG